MNRVVITGLGVAAPNGVGIDNFTTAIKNGVSGIRYCKELEDLNFSCRIGGIPVVPEELKQQYLTPLQLKNFNSSGILYGCIAGMDAWKDAGLSINTTTTPDWDSGTVFGTAVSGVDKFSEAIYKLDAGNVRTLGSTAVLQTMASGISAYLGGILGLGNLVTTNSSACRNKLSVLVNIHALVAASLGNKPLPQIVDNLLPWLFASTPETSPKVIPLCTVVGGVVLGNSYN